MKMKPEHFVRLQKALDATFVEMNSCGKTRTQFVDSYRENGLSDKRLRWDCLWTVEPLTRSQLFKDFYEYLDDNHIDTALRAYFGHSA